MTSTSSCLLMFHGFPVSTLINECRCRDEDGTEPSTVTLAGLWPFCRHAHWSNSYQAPRILRGKSGSFQPQLKRGNIPGAAWWLLGPQSCYPGTPTSASPKRKEEAKTCSRRPSHLVFRRWLESWESCVGTTRRQLTFVL